jgi:hypothetical protein
MREVRRSVEGMTQREGGGLDMVFEPFERMPSSVYYLGMLGSIAASLYLFLSGRRWEALFVGLWPPTILNAALFYKLLHPSREM